MIRAGSRFARRTGATPIRSHEFLQHIRAGRDIGCRIKPVAGQAGRTGA